jgi:hypothetical protein
LPPHTRPTILSSGANGCFQERLSLDDARLSPSRKQWLSGTRHEPLLRPARATYGSGHVHTVTEEAARAEHESIAGQPNDSLDDVLTELRGLHHGDVAMANLPPMQDRPGQRKLSRA